MFGFAYFNGLYGKCYLSINLILYCEAIDEGLVCIFFRFLPFLKNS